uniref:Uncharacterized protein n=1 Tax=Arion vulgaris TaxID=1028688 RepID=A0A0B7BHQ7_9EUPU
MSMKNEPDSLQSQTQNRLQPLSTHATDTDHSEHANLVNKKADMDGALVKAITSIFMLLVVTAKTLFILFSSNPSTLKL